MKIQYASDLHIEFSENNEFLKANLLKKVGDILILAGDIVPFKVLNRIDDFFQYLSDNFENTYWIPGNHEYYQYNLADKQGMFHEKIKKNVHLLNNVKLDINGIDFLFTTLWSHISPRNQWQIQSSMNDFHVIQNGDEILSIEQYNSLHNESISFLNNNISSGTAAKSIVVSHHAPTLMNYPEQYKGDVLNEAFAVELFDFIEKHQPDYWIYGHTHSNTDDFNIGKTCLVTNQLGYVGYNEHKDFEINRVFEL